MIIPPLSKVVVSISFVYCWLLLCPLNPSRRGTSLVFKFRGDITDYGHVFLPQGLASGKSIPLGRPRAQPLLQYYNLNYYNLSLLSIYLYTPYSLVVSIIAWRFSGFASSITVPLPII
jgi:hypothetical protein